MVVLAYLEAKLSGGDGDANASSLPLTSSPHIYAAACLPPAGTSAGRLPYALRLKSAARSRQKEKKAPHTHILLQQPTLVASSCVSTNRGIGESMANNKSWI